MVVPSLLGSTRKHFPLQYMNKSFASVRMTVAYTCLRLESVLVLAPASAMFLIITTLLYRFKLFIKCNMPVRLAITGGPPGGGPRRALTCWFGGGASWPNASADTS
jgi:hypothetical protein